MTTTPMTTPTTSRRIQIALPPPQPPPRENSDDEEEEEFDAPPLARPIPSVWESLRNQALNFAINVECTSLCLSKSGYFLWAGFSDGTLRVFDLTGRFGLEEDHVSSSRQKSAMFVSSKWHQTFGAVACQIHARGVHTDLLTHVDACGSDDFVFGGVQRGAMELYAIDVRALEEAAASPNTPTQNILDYITVHTHADAKLKGFGACVKLAKQKRPTYLLLTGKGIKNIHIWKFQPPLLSDEEPIWEQVYDTQTNGNTIHLLSFFRNPQGKLLGISQSDSQKLRLWDLSSEEDEDPETNRSPKRPPYQDVVNSKGALGIAGGFCVCGGPTMYNQLSIVSLDQPKSAYNHTELALPLPGGVSPGRGRQRRGDLKQVVRVASMSQDASHVLLELNDGSIVQYAGTDPQGLPQLSIVNPADSGIPSMPGDFWRRTLCLGKPSGVAVAAVSMYNPNTQKGQLVVRALQDLPLASPVAADPRALELCMQAPPSSVTRKRPKRLEMTPPHKTRSTEQVQKVKRKKAAMPLSMEKVKKIIPMSVEKKPLSDDGNHRSPEQVKKKKMIIPQSIENVKKTIHMSVESVEKTFLSDDGKNRSTEQVQKVNKKKTALSQSMEKFKKVIPMSVVTTSISGDGKCRSTEQVNNKKTFMPPSMERVRKTSPMSVVTTPLSDNGNYRSTEQGQKVKKKKKIIPQSVEKIIKTIPMSVEKSNRKASVSVEKEPLTDDEKSRSTEQGRKVKKKVTNIVPLSAEKSKRKVPFSAEKSTRKVPMSIEKASLSDDEKSAISMSSAESLPKKKNQTATMIPPSSSKRLTPLKIRARSEEDDDKSLPLVQKSHVAKDLAQVSPDQRGVTSPPTKQPNRGAMDKFLEPMRVLHHQSDQEYAAHQAQLKRKFPSVPRKKRMGEENQSSLATTLNFSPTKKDTRTDQRSPNESLNEKLVPKAISEVKVIENSANSEKSSLDANSADSSSDRNQSKKEKKSRKIPKINLILPQSKRAHEDRHPSMNNVQPPKKSITHTLDRTPLVDQSLIHNAKTKPKKQKVKEPLSKPKQASFKTVKSQEVNNSMSKLNKKRPRQSKTDAVSTPKVTEKKRPRPASEKDSPLSTPKVTEKKRPRPASEKDSPLNIANILCELKSPGSSPGSGKSKVTSVSDGVATGVRLNLSPASPAALSSREVVMTERIAAQYTQVCELLDSLPSQSNIFNRGPQPNSTAHDLDSVQAQARTRLSANHRAAHEMIQRRVLRAAERTLYFLIDSCISVEVARADLKEIIRSYEEVVYDTLMRQELEVCTLASQQTFARGGLEAPTTQVSFPFQSAFQKVEDIYKAIEPLKRPPGRPPRSAGPSIL